MSSLARLKRYPSRLVLSGLFVSGAALAQAQPPAADAAASLPLAPAVAAAAPASVRDDFEPVRPLGTAGSVAGYTLERCIALTLHNYPRIHEARERLEYRRQQQVQSWSAPYSEFNVTGGLALAPEVHGSVLYSADTDVAITSKMGIGWNIGLEGVVPLYTFGKITNLWDASAAQVKVAEQDVEKEKNNIKQDVRRAYYGVQLARDAMSLMGEAESRIDKYLGGL